MAKRKLQFALCGALLCGHCSVNAATLNASFTPISQGSVVNLTTEGPLDWVHWGLNNETSLNRKATVAPQIGDFTVVDATNGFAQVFHYADNYNGYSWNDGNPAVSVTNTPTGVWAYGTPNIGSGFELTVPADTSEKTLKVFVGTFAARGRFTASLSDGSVANYTNASLLNMGNGPGGVYTINYAAGSTGQYLTVRWVVTQTFRPDGNVTLQAAALTALGANNPPFVRVQSPQNNSNFTAPADVTIEADAFDPDGTVSKVKFFEGTTNLGESTSSPYALVWNNVLPGRYLLSAQAIDNGGVTSTSSPVEIFVSGGEAALSGGVALPPASVDLTTEGTADWAHWGLSSAASFNHKAGVPQQISNFTIVGANNAQQYSDNYTAYGWTDGTPTASTNGTRTGVFIHGLNNGFMLTAPADTNSRTLKVYVGLYGAQGNFQAYLSDFSAPVYTDTSLSNVFGNAYAVHTLNYAAASAGQTLTVKYTAATLYDADFGNVTLQAATLSGASAPPDSPPVVAVISPTNNATFTAPANITITADASDSDGTIRLVEFFNRANKLGQTTNSPYSLIWSNVAAGSYTLATVATDNLGAATTSSPVNITVSNPNLPPTVTITSPTNNSTFTAPANITITATVTDSDGMVSKVEFFQGTTKLGETTSAPYSLVWSNVAAGSYTLTAKATDNSVATATSSPVTVSVATNTTTSVIIVNPAINGGQFHCSLQTQNGVNYTVQFTDSLSPINWQTLTNLAGDSSIANISDGNSSGSERFYRVKAE